MTTTETMAARLEALKQDVKRRTGVRLVAADELDDRTIVAPMPDTDRAPVIDPEHYARIMGEATRLRQDLRLKDIEITDLRQMIGLLREQIGLLKRHAK